MPRPRTGSVTFRKGRWYARLTLSRLPLGADGRHPRLEHAVEIQGQPLTAETKADEARARKWAQRAQELYDAGEWTPPGAAKREVKVAPAGDALTVAAWCDWWLGEQDYSEAARDRRRTKEALALLRPDGWSLGAVKLSAVTPQDIAAWLAIVRTRQTTHGPTKAPKPLAPRTVRNNTAPVARRTDALDTLLDALAPLLAAGDRKAARPRDRARHRGDLGGVPRGRAVRPRLLALVPRPLSAAGGLGPLAASPSRGSARRRPDRRWAEGRPGRARADVVRLLPSGRALDNRAVAKVRARDTGWRYVVRQLVAEGASEPGADLDAWLDATLPSITRPLPHAGNLKYVFPLARGVAKTVGEGLPYVKLCDLGLCAGARMHRPTCDRAAA